MKLMKVYRQCVNSPKPITELCRRDTLNSFMMSVVMSLVDDSVEMSDFLETNDIEDNAEFLQAYEKKSDEIYDNFLKYHTMDCGDYYIVACEDDEEVNRPN
mgnify:CR=1 FL=1